MAIYVYRCEEHGEFEKIVKISDADLPQQCPECQVDCARIPFVSGGSSSVHFKGDGWFGKSKSN
jgi:putative FmdB family regulatory protein